MSCLGNFIPPLGHSTIALVIASSSVGAQERWSWRMYLKSFGSLPASRQPSSHFWRIISSFDSGAPTVIRPSAYWPVFLAVTGPAVAM